MTIQTILLVVVLLCAQEGYTRYATLNIGLNISARMSDESSQLTEQMVRICMKETQLSMADLEKFKNNEVQDSEINESTQCFAHCIYEQLGILKNGLFLDNEDSQKMIMNTKSNEIGGDFAVCQSIRGQNKCETAYKIHLCMQKVRNSVRDQALSMISEASNNRNEDTDDDDDSGDNLNVQ